MTKSRQQVFKAHAFAIVASTVLISWPVRAEEAPSPAFAKRQAATLMALRNLCLAEHPNMKSTLENKWVQSFDEKTLQWMTGLQTSKEFSAMSSEVKKEVLKNKSDNLAQCEEMFGISAK